MPGEPELAPTPLPSARTALAIQNTSTNARETLRNERYDFALAGLEAISAEGAAR